MASSSEIPTTLTISSNNNVITPNVVPQNKPTAQQAVVEGKQKSGFNAFFLQAFQGWVQLTFSQTFEKFGSRTISSAAK